MTIESSLLCYYSKKGPERGGIITKMGPEECQNICENPEEGFELSFEDLDRLDYPDLIGTFHTHPGGSSNLSYGDYESFLSYPMLKHYIVGEDGVRAYKTVNGRLVNEG